jgi:hypothetical protein
MPVYLNLGISWLGPRLFFKTEPPALRASSPSCGSWDYGTMDSLLKGFKQLIGGVLPADHEDETQNSKIVLDGMRDKIDGP